MKRDIFTRVRAAACRLAAADVSVDADDVVRHVGLPGCAADREEGMDRLVELNSVLCRETAASISASLSSKAIAHFFAKGVALLELGVYQNRERILSDVDVYVRPQDWSRSIDALESDGLRTLREGQQSGPESLRSALSMEKAATGSIDNVQVDLHRSLDPLDRLLPRPDATLEPAVWQSIDESCSVPIPSTPVHCFILLHQLVHTDLLQFHNLIDLSLMFGKMSAEDYRELGRMAAHARIVGFLHSVSELMIRDLGVTLCDRDPAPGKTVPLQLDALLQNAFSATMAERSMITTRRIKTRIALLDGNPTRMLLADVLFPPGDFLRWRWKLPAPLGFTIHLAQILRKVVRL